MDYDFDIYIAGPMTGRPLFNHPAFNAAEAKYAALGYRVFNPAKNGLPPESPWREHMRVDIAALLRSRSVVLLDGWMDSLGAIKERLEELGWEIRPAYLAAQSAPQAQEKS